MKKINLITMVGSSTSVTTLRPLLQHYSGLGVNSFWIYVHTDRAKGRVADEIASIVASFRGVRLIPISGEWLSTQERAFASKASHPDDWFILVDHDEFQLYPDDLPKILAKCDSDGFDHINGCLIDRVSLDGSLRALDLTKPIWDQYPIGLFLTMPVCGSPARKVVACKGSVGVSSGHHYATCGNPVPMRNLFIESHHFKWIAGVDTYLESRIAINGRSDWVTDHLGGSDQRFLHFFRSNGNRIDVKEPALMPAICKPHYPHWDVVTRICNMDEISMRIKERIKILEPASQIR